MMLLVVSLLRMISSVSVCYFLDVAGGLSAADDIVCQRLLLS
jgi:hypothetical protein